MATRSGGHAFDECLNAALSGIDEGFSATSLPIASRPFYAAVAFVETCVIQVDTDDRGPRPTGVPTAFAVEPWFADVFERVDSWYRTRYGAAYDRSRGRTVSGVVVTSGIPYELSVPPTVTRPVEPGRTAWLIFADSVLPDETPTRWLRCHPPLDQLSTRKRQSVVAMTEEIATALRRSRNILVGVAWPDRNARGLGDGIVTNLETGARRILNHTVSGEIQRCHWDLHMAVEAAFKVFLRQKQGTFPRIHDLDELFARSAAHGLVLDHSLLKKLPSWHEAADLRYAQGSRDDVRLAFETYRVVLKLVPTIVGGLERLDLTGAQFLLRRPPWLSRTNVS